jgi:hypothetical protein
MGIGCSLAARRVRPCCIIGLPGPAHLEGRTMNYDVVGDVHGHAGALTALLEKLGYRERAGVYRHPDRTAVFLGDFSSIVGRNR